MSTESFFPLLAKVQLGFRLMSNWSVMGSSRMELGVDILCPWQDPASENKDAIRFVSMPSLVGGYLKSVWELYESTFPVCELYDSFRARPILVGVSTTMPPFNSDLGVTAVESSAYGRCSWASRYVKRTKGFLDDELPYFSCSLTWELNELLFEARRTKGEAGRLLSLPPRLPLPPVIPATILLLPITPRTSRLCSDLKMNVLLKLDKLYQRVSIVCLIRVWWKVLN